MSKQIKYSCSKKYFIFDIRPTTPKRLPTSDLVDYQKLISWVHDNSNFNSSVLLFIAILINVLQSYSHF